MDTHSDSQRFFLTFPASVASSATPNFYKKQGSFTMFLPVFDIFAYKISTNQAGIFLFPTDLCNRPISSARLWTDIIRNRAISKLPKISLIQSWSHQPCYLMRCHELPKYGNYCREVNPHDIVTLRRNLAFLVTVQSCALYIREPKQDFWHEESVK